MSQANRTFERVLQALTEQPEVMSVSLIGSGALHYRNLEEVVDVDLLVLVDIDGHESREVKIIDDTEFDFTYLAVKTMAAAIDKKSHIWLNILSNAKHVFKRTEQIGDLLKLANRTYADGPVPLSQERIGYIRFRLTKKLDDLAHRIDNPSAFQYLAGICLKDLTESYFRLQDTWVPRDKKMMLALFERDIVIYELLKATFKASDPAEHYQMIKDILEYVLKPYGGPLNTLVRQNTTMEE